MYHFSFCKVLFIVKHNKNVNIVRYFSYKNVRYDVTLKYLTVRYFALRFTMQSTLQGGSGSTLQKSFQKYLTKPGHGAPLQGSRCSMSEAHAVAVRGSRGWLFEARRGPGLTLFEAVSVGGGCSRRLSGVALGCSRLLGSAHGWALNQSRF